MDYVMSDLHGCYNEFKKMLSLINFSDQDKLFILGDILDKGKNSLQIMDYVMYKKNICLIKGNHEYAFEKFFEEGSKAKNYSKSKTRTYSQIAKRGYKYELKLYRYIKKLPKYKVYKKFILVHAGIKLPHHANKYSINEIVAKYNDDKSLMKDRYLKGNKKYRNFTIICGHTPVQILTKNKNHNEIVKLRNIFFIDCGCVYKKFNGRLACLRLDDLVEFYV